jgi:hypothetical protein
MIICKDCGKSVAPEECRNLKVVDPKETFGFRLDQLCEECFKARLKDKAENPAPVGSGRYPWGMDHDPLKHDADIREIINQAMDRDDKEICIYVRGETMTVKVNSYKEEKLSWIKKECDWFVCPECGGDSRIPTRYCSRCGEQLAIPTRITEEPDGDTEC